MKCPFCGEKNIDGIDECESCSANLSSIDGVVPKTKIEKVLMEDPISKLRPHEAVFVSPQEPVSEAIKKMTRGGFGCLLVSKKENSVDGILSERDIVYKVAFAKKNPAKMKVEEIMTINPTTLEEGDTLACALNQMSIGGYRHIPIMSEGKPAGIISIRDILKYLSKLFP